MIIGVKYWKHGGEINMLNPYDVVNFFFNLNPGRKLFNRKLITRNGSTFYEGNARLNKYLHLAQNIYLAMTGELLMDTAFYAYSNGAVIPFVQRDYRVLSAKAKEVQDVLDDVKVFLTKLYMTFENADIDEIIEIDHQDEAWIEKSKYTNYEQQKMDTLAHKEEYKTQYADMIKVLNGVKIC